MSLVDRLNEVAADGAISSISYTFVQSEVSASCDTVNARVQRLCERSVPSLHVTELRLRKIRRVSFCTDPTQYVRELRLLAGMVASAEEDMNSQLVQDYRFQFQNPQEDELQVRTVI